VYLLDTNVLLRIAQPGHSSHQEARSCVRSLLRRKESVFLIPQILFEFWVVATRPVDKNGLGLSVENVRRKIERAESFFDLHLDTPSIYREWLRLVEANRVAGVAAHDARIVAAMKVHGLTHLVTFNTSDFKRYDGSEITVLTPTDLLRTLTKPGAAS
jgi:predicted nucleic acid-binding protein